MKYIYTCDTDIGISRKVNQDALLVKKGKYKGKEILMAIVCDGMGGLQKGEEASATVIQAFSHWFETELIHYLKNFDVIVLSQVWSSLLESLNDRIKEYASTLGITMGTTFTGILCYDDDFLIAHVGDSRLYRIQPEFQLITTDQTYVQREYEKGNITLEEAENHPKRNVLLQCVGASTVLIPQIMEGKVKSNAVYLLCSDGFRHNLEKEEIEHALAYEKLVDENEMHERVINLIELVKARKEKDNISVILIKTM